MPLSGLQKLFISSGHCEERNDHIVIAENADSVEKIKWFWVVVKAMASEWKTKKAKTKHNEIMKECIDNYVEQYVLVMDTDPTPMSSMSGRVDDRRDLQTGNARVTIKIGHAE
jgi:DNA replication initiation complex subunit (GINS family)